MTTKEVEAAVNAVRARIRGYNSPPMPVSAQQQATQKSHGRKGPLWISKVAFPAPCEDDARQMLFRSIERLSEEQETWSQPQTVTVDAEWNGHRRSEHAMASEHITAQEEYDGIMRDISSSLTIMHVHGGGFYLHNPNASRSVTANLTKLTGGRCLSIHYRLAPQNPFPAALLDLLIVYLSLLNPPQGALHNTVPASSIVFTGDSSGANLCLSLLQVILDLGRNQSTSKPTVRFNNQDVQLPVPAGLAAICAFIDLTYGLPSVIDNQKFDIIFGREGSPLLRPDFPACAAWPTDPPRGYVYCDISALVHPLVSPTVVRNWVGAPPMMFICGEEVMADSNKLIAQRAAAQGVSVRWEQYSMLPHIFMILLGELSHSTLCFQNWAQFCQECVMPGAEKIGYSGTMIQVETLQSKEVKLEDLTSLTFDEAVALMKQVRGEKKVWYGPTKIKKSTL